MLATNNTSTWLPAAKASWKCGWAIRQTVIIRRWKRSEKILMIFSIHHHLVLFRPFPHNHHFHLHRPCRLFQPYNLPHNKPYHSIWIPDHPFTIHDLPTTLLVHNRRRRLHFFPILQLRLSTILTLLRSMTKVQSLILRHWKRRRFVWLFVNKIRKLILICN